MEELLKKVLVSLGYQGSWLQELINNLSWFRSHRVKKHKKERHKNLVIYGCEMLDELYKAADEAGVNIWLEWGTLLGAYREQSFIGHDYDCDTGILASDYSLEFENVLMKHGFFKKHALFLTNRETNEQILCELTYVYKDFEVDMTFSFIKDGKRVIYAPCAIEGDHPSNEFEIHAYEHDYPLPVEHVTINGHQYNAPCNPQNVLINTYGPTFMTPDPNFVTCNQKDNVIILDFNKQFIATYGQW